MWAIKGNPYYLKKSSKFNLYLAIALVKYIFCSESILLQANNVNKYFCRS